MNGDIIDLNDAGSRCEQGRSDANGAGFKTQPELAPLNAFSAVLLAQVLHLKWNLRHPPRNLHQSGRLKALLCEYATGTVALKWLNISRLV